MPKRTRSAASEAYHERRDRRLSAFHTNYRRFVQHLTVCSAAAEDLADSFPGLLFALATGFGDEKSRGATFDLVDAGAPLRQAADALGLPWWLRRLPAEAFTEPLGHIPCDTDFSSRVVSHVPRSGAAAARWLAAVLQANRCCGPEFALWTAKSLPLLLPESCDRTLAWLAAWAWHSGHPDTLGHRIVRRHWCPAMSVRRAREELTIWQRRVSLAISLGDGIEDTWLRGGFWQGYEFVALRTVDDFIAESAAMENCLDRFAEEISCDVSRVFSIRKNGSIVADIEVAPDSRDTTRPGIIQLRGPRNRPAPPEVWQAAFSWISRQTLDRAKSRSHSIAEARAAVRHAFWRPYLEWLPEAERRSFEARVVHDSPRLRSRLARTLRPNLPRNVLSQLQQRLEAFSLASRATPGIDRYE